MTTEQNILIESVKTTGWRISHGDLADMIASIESGGLRHPITVWRDGTLVSGERRLRCHFLLGAVNPKFRRIPAVFVDTIEDAAKRLHTDAQDTQYAQTMKPSEIVRLWETLRRLDAPAAVKRHAAAQRRGIELRRQALEGTRQPGRTKTVDGDYFLHVLGKPFNMSESTASRLWTIYAISRDPAISPERRTAAAKAMREMDEGVSSIWGNYAHLVSKRPAPSRPRPARTIDPAPAKEQITAWAKALPQLEGLTSGLVELGPTNPALTWEQVGPVHARLMVIRREMEKIIRQMKEINK